MRIVLGNLLTDQPDLLNGQLEEAENCIPYEQSYGPFPEPVAYSAAVPANVIGGISTKDINNNVVTFLGTQTALYKESATTIQDISRTVTYTTANTGSWEFEAFGNTMLAVNGVDPIQVYTAGTSTRFLDMSASASAPVARHIAAVRDFIFLGDLSTGRNRVQWSRFNNPLRYDVSQRFQSDYQDLPGASQIVVRITGGDFATILTDTSVWLATYVGSPVIWRFDEVAPGTGCIASGSVARFQNMTFFLSRSGMYMFDGQQAIPIGKEQIDDTLLADLNTAYTYRITSCIDPVRKIYMMAYPSVNSTDGTPDRILVYSWAVQRFTLVNQDCRLVFNHMTTGLTLEGLDAYGTMESLPYSLDSEIWQGGTRNLAVVNSSNRIALLTGAAKMARFTTGEAQIFDDGRTFIRNVRPLVQGNSASTVTAYVGGRDLLTEPVAWTNGSGMNVLGDCPVRDNHRYHRIKLTVEGGFERVMGFDLGVVPEGRR